ncbi:MAG: hypothetical protein ACE5H7_05510 [Acidiferrobacterales bacterium]
MSEKQKVIKRMLELQKKFIDYEHNSGLNPADYFDTPLGHPLEDYRKEYDELTRKLVDLAHAEKGSHR